jgi:phosphoglucomutase
LQKSRRVFFVKMELRPICFEDLRTTPELSFAVRHLGAYAGIVITASHNPREYNGYKVYGQDGAQISLEASCIILDQIQQIKDITTIHGMDLDTAKEKGLLEIIAEKVDAAYIHSLKSLVQNPDVIARKGKDLKIVFTPIHGSANIPVRRVLSEVGFENVYVVKEQEKPDGEFPTVKYPNPEEKEVFTLALKIAKEKDADLVIGTDPDGDRMGVLVKRPDGEFEVLTGNQTGSLLLEYIIQNKKRMGKLPPNPFVAKTIVTTELSRKIARENHVHLVEVLTGFKFIGEQILKRQDQGDEHFLFGFEESYGYLAGTFSRDKDAVVASLLISEVAASFKLAGKNLYDGLMELYEKYGYYEESITTFTLSGKHGLTKINETMEYLRKEQNQAFGECKVIALRDYLSGTRYDFNHGSIETLDLPTSDVLYYELAFGDWFCIRPSGTEPKLKIYYGVSEKTSIEAKSKLRSLKSSVLGTVEKFLQE